MLKFNNSAWEAFHILFFKHLPAENFSALYIIFLADNIRLGVSARQTVTLTRLLSVICNPT